MERPPSTPVSVILSGSLLLLWKRPVLMRRFSCNDDSQRQTFMFKTPPFLPSHSLLLLLLLIVCLHAMFCFCPSVPALLLSTHRHINFSPRACLTSSASHKLSPLPHPHDVHVYPRLHCCLMWHGDVKDQTKMPSAPSATEAGLSSRIMQA